MSVLANVQGTMFIQSLIDDYIAPMLTQDVPDFSPLAGAIARVACLYLIGVLASYAWNRIMINVTQGTLRNVRDDLFSHMESLPIKYFDTHVHGDIMSTYTNDTETLRQMISQSMPQVFNSAITIVSVLISMIILSIPLTAVTLVMVAVMLVVTKKVAGLSGRYFLEQQTNLGKVNGFIEEMMNGQKVVKVFNHEQTNWKAFEEKSARLQHVSQKAQAFAQTMVPMVVSLSYVNYAIVTLVGGWMVLTGLSDLGSLASYLVFVRQAAMPINQFTQQSNLVLVGVSGAERIFEFMEQKEEVDDGKVKLGDEEGKPVWLHPRADGRMEVVPVRGDVVFDQVDFGYTPRHPILKNLSLYAKPGQKVAFVGATGAGKTTITNLINRFYELQGGAITFDGIDIRLIQKDDLRKSLGIVLQDTHLFTGTIADNIRFGKLDATNEEVERAAKLANAHSFIERLPDGYDTMITNDGASLSQGQRQLLAIARTAIADPPVLILDEATSSIDTRTEKLIEKGMDALMEGRTVFVIAHRLSTIRNADVIIVLDHGQIVERGSHDELLEKQGMYYQLYEGMFELS